MSEAESTAWGNFYCWLHNLAERRRQKNAVAGVADSEARVLAEQSNADQAQPDKGHAARQEAK